MNPNNITKPYVNLTQRSTRFTTNGKIPEQGILNLYEIVFEGRIDLNNVARDYALQGDLNHAQQILGRIQSDLNPQIYGGNIRESLYQFAKDECITTLGILSAIRTPNDYNITESYNHKNPIRIAF